MSIILFLLIGIFTNKEATPELVWKIAFGYAFLLGFTYDFLILGNLCKRLNRNTEFYCEKLDEYYKNKYENEYWNEEEL